MAKRQDNGAAPSGAARGATGTERAALVRDKFDALKGALASTYRDREELADAVLHAIVARHHVCVVGPPGAAKSALLMALEGVVTDAVFFDTLLSRFSVEEDVFGPRSLAAMKADKWERVLDGRLADAHFAFLDEIFKSNGSLLNALLRILNERLYQGARRPLWTCVAASNELQEDESLDALWDRFLLRLEVTYVAERTRRELLRRRPPRFVAPVTLTLAEIELAHEAAMAIDPVLSDPVADELIRLGKALETEGIVVSDRRWIQIGDLLRAAAWLDGSEHVELDHFETLKWALWTKRDDIAKVRAKLAALDSGPVGQAAEIVDNAVRAFDGRPTDAAEYRRVQGELVNRVEEARRQVDAIVGQGVTRRAEERIARKRAALDDAYATLRSDLAKRLRLGV